MIGWFRVPLDAAKSLTGDHKATRTEAMIDLLGRWHIGGNPGVRELMRAWDWSGDRVTKLVAEMRVWAAENGATAPDEKAPNKIGQRPDSDRTVTGHPEVAATPAIQVSPDSDRTAIGQPPDASCARVPFVEREEDGEKNTERAQARPTAPKADEAAALYSAFRNWHPRAPESPSPASRKALRAILAECGGPERAESYLAWVHEAQDRYARQIRGQDPWPDNTVKARHDLESLSRHIPSRMPEVEAWERRGRTTAQRPTNAPRPAPGAPPGRLHALDLLDQALLNLGE